MKKSLVIGVLCLVLLILLFAVSDPSKLPSSMLVLPFLLIFVLLQSCAALVLQLRGITGLRSWRLGALYSAVPLILLILQSIGQLTIRDLLTIAALFLLSYFYISRTTVS